MLTDQARRYRWADEDYDLAWTVAVITGMGPDDVVRQYGGDPAQPIGEYTLAQLADIQGGEVDDPTYHVQVFVHSGLTVAVEPVGWAGVMPEVSRRCSVGGRFFAVHWSLSTNPRFNEAIDGRVVAQFEMYAGDKPYVGAPVPRWITGVTVEPTALRSTALALLERQTGLAFDRRWVDEPWPAYRIPDPGY